MELVYKMVPWVIQIILRSKKEREKRRKGEWGVLQENGVIMQEKEMVRNAEKWSYNK